MSSQRPFNASKFFHFQKAGKGINFIAQMRIFTQMAHIDHTI